jgi:alpha-glucosidase
VDSAFTFYEDDGKTNDYKKGVCRETKISVTSGSRVVVAFDSTGDYASPIREMYLDVIHREKAPFSVHLNEEELPHFLHRDAFEAADTGWYYSQTLKSVQIKYPAQAKSHYEIVISMEVFDLVGM